MRFAFDDVLGTLRSGQSQRAYAKRRCPGPWSKGEMAIVLQLRVELIMDWSVGELG
jgi:hypothetical protein